jgi:hypothetical protein
VGVRIQKNIDGGHLRLVLRRKREETLESCIMSFIISIWVIRLRGIRCVGHVAWRGEMPLMGFCEHSDESEGVGVT